MGMSICAGWYGTLLCAKKSKKNTEQKAVWFGEETIVPEKTGCLNVT